METLIQNVKDFDPDKLRALEEIVGKQLNQDQQVLIRVSNVGTVPDQQARIKALAKAADIARRGRSNVAAMGISEQEVDAAIDEAIQSVRQQ